MTCTILDYLAQFPADDRLSMQWSYDNPRQRPVGAWVFPGNPEPLRQFRSGQSSEVRLPGDKFPTLMNPNGPDGRTMVGVVGEDGVWRWDGQGGYFHFMIGKLTVLTCAPSTDPLRMMPEI